MSIEAELNAELREAMKAKDQARLDVIRAVKTELAKKIAEPDFSGEPDDDVARAVIDSFVKRAKKAQAEYAGLGERGRAMAEKLAFEVDYLQRWLPQKLDEDATRAIVQEAVVALGATDPADKGKVIGHVMKSHRDEVDGQLVARLVGEALGG